MDPIKDFLNPQSMLTPGIAGASIMAIINTLSMQFDLARPWPALMALLLSALCCALALSTDRMPWWRKGIYFVLNSLVIFSVASGVNGLGNSGGAAQVSLADKAHYALRRVTAMPEALAQEPEKPGWCCLNGQLQPAAQSACLGSGGRFFADKQAADNACRPSQPAAPPRDGPKKFFRPWL
jgi:hypothetical protein